MAFVVFVSSCFTGWIHFLWQGYSNEFVFIGPQARQSALVTTVPFIGGFALLPCDSTGCLTYWGLVWCLSVILRISKFGYPYFGTVGFWKCSLLRTLWYRSGTNLSLVICDIWRRCFSDRLLTLAKVSGPVSWTKLCKLCSHPKVIIWLLSSWYHIQ